MSNEPKWIPKKLEGIEFGNPVIEEFDTEKHPISASLGNEDGQNKIDATLQGKKGKVSIHYQKVNNNSFFNKYFLDLQKHQKFSEYGFSEKVDKNCTDFLVIEDFNTFGLTGNL